MKRILTIGMLIVGFLLFTSPAVTALSDKADTSPGIVLAVIGAAVTVLAITTKSRAGFANGVEVEMWGNYIIERLWKDNQFLQHAFSDDDKVLAGKIVHIAQPGSKPQVVKNRAVFPAATIRRTDTDIVYVLDEYTTDPTHIQDAEKIEPAYDKIDSVYGDHAGTITETIGDDIILKWLVGAPAGSILKTSGAATAATLAGATGNRKAAVHKDIRRANLMLNVKNIAKGERFGLLEENMADQIFESLSDNQARVFTEYADAKTGVLGQLYGFKIMTRSSVAAASNADVINALGAVGAVTDASVSMFWQKNAVARALGEVKFFENVNDPQYYGDVYSALVRMGGRRRRADNLGVVALIQDQSA